jgi:hypothetical protein
MDFFRWVYWLEYTNCLSSANKRLSIARSPCQQADICRPPLMPWSERSLLGIFPKTSLALRDPSYRFLDAFIARCFSLRFADPDVVFLLE